MTTRIRSPLTTSLIALLLVVGAPAAIALAIGEEVDLRLQIDWWGGPATSWEGLVTIDQGRLADLQLLGFDVATPGSIRLGRQRMVIDQKSKQKYNGAILSVTGNGESQLRMEFVSGGETQAKVFDVTLNSLIGLTERAKSFELDSSGNKIWIRRAAGDEIRVAVNRQCLVFDPNEGWAIDIFPHQLASQGRLPRECRLSMLDAAGREVWADSLNVQPPVRGQIPPLRKVDIKVPEVEGVYTLKIELVVPTRRLPPFRTEKTSTQRSVQFVVIDKTRPQDVSASEKDRIVSEFDPTEDRWWDRLKLLPQWSILPGLRHDDGSLSNLRPQEKRHGDSNWVKIPMGGWQAFPLPVEDLHQRHELTIEYPGDLPQTTTFSVIEPDSTGKVRPIQLDSGVHVALDDVSGVGARPTKTAQHTIPFWPSTKSPLLLVTNADSKFASMVGKIRVSSVAETPVLSKSGARRKLVANFDRPLFIENFSAVESVDTKSGRSFEDWTTFYDGGRRMVEHLRRNGFDAVALSCFAEGSSLFPNTAIQPTPKYDRGIFFSDGRDPLRKDVLEMLFRLCDRERVTLIPSFEFATRLHTLETTLNDSRSTEGIRLVNRLGQTYAEATNDRSGIARAIYNPLDVRVQQAMLGIVRDVARRYGRHRAFGGVKINFTQESFTQLPGVEWGMDRVTLRRFRSDAGVVIRDPMTDLPGAREDTLSADVIAKWRHWRCAQLAKFYGNAHAELRRIANRADIVLSLSDLLKGDSILTNVAESPSKSLDVDRQLSDYGIDLRLLSKERGLIVPLPRRLFPSVDLATQATDMELSNSDDVAAGFRTMSFPATLFHHEPFRKRIPSFEELSPFGKDNTYMSLVAHVSPSGGHQRERFAHGLAGDDSLMLFDGGWMLPMGQEESLRPFAAVYRSLPAVRFQPIENREVEERVRPLVIRSLVRDGETYFYIVNDSPWTVGIDLQFRSEKRALTMRSVGRNRDGRLEPKGGLYEWSAHVDPYELIAVAMSSPDVTLSNGRSTLPPDVSRGLEERIEQLQARIRYLRRPTPYSAPPNSNFETAAGTEPVPSWRDTAPDRDWVRLAAGYKSAQSMRLAAQDGILTVRSETFPPPKTDQLAVEFVAKFPSAQNRSTKQRVGLRVVVEQGDSAIANWGPGSFRVSPLDDGWAKVILPLRNVSVLPSRSQHDELAETGLTLRFDVEHGNNIQVDNIRLYDTMLLDADELLGLVNKIALAKYMRRNGYFGDCNRFLNSYWPQYLLQTVPAAPKASPAVTRRSPPKRKPIRTSDSWKRFIPRFPGLR